MPEPIVIAPGGGEVIGDSPERRVDVLSDHDRLHATWSRYGPGREGADLHVHRRHSDLFYVLAGELTVRLGPDGAPVAATAGTLVRVPPLVVHGFRNAAETELRYLNFHAPGRGFADYLRALRDGRTLVYDQEPPPADGGRSPADAAVGEDPYAVELDGVRVALLADVEEIAVAELRCEPAAIAPPPAPDTGLRSLYVLEGALVLEWDDGEVVAHAGAWVHVPPGLPHACAAGGDEPARLLDVRAPGGGYRALLRP